MLVIQPPFTSQYFCKRKKDRLPKTTFRSFYLSWEDALWHLLSTYRVKNRSNILLPEFFCGNVVEHMEEHGLVPHFYRVKENLLVDYENFIELIDKVKPTIIVVFHPVGITNSLMNTTKQWLSKETILIEDCVHKIINPEEIKFFSDRHFILDSLRKVAPIQGTNVYSPCCLPTISMIDSLLTLPYRVGVLYWWIAMQIHLLLAYAGWENIKSNLRAESAMMRGYDLIGKSKRPSPGIWAMNYLSQKIATEKIGECKERQAIFYQENLSNLLSHSSFWIPLMARLDYKRLRGFPVIIQLKVSDRFLKHLRENGIIVRFELNDGLWSKKRKIVYLPMGIHVSDDDLDIIVRTIRSYCV